MNSIETKKDNKLSSSKNKYVVAPWPIFIFQWSFLILMCFFAVVQLPMGPFGLPWNTFIVCWLSFLVLIVTSFGYIFYKNKKEEK